MKYWKTCQSFFLIPFLCWLLGPCNLCECSKGVCDNRPGPLSLEPHRVVSSQKGHVVVTCWAPHQFCHWFFSLSPCSFRRLFLHGQHRGVWGAPEAAFPLYRPRSAGRLLQYCPGATNPGIWLMDGLLATTYNGHFSLECWFADLAQQLWRVNFTHF